MLPSRRVVLTAGAWFCVAGNRPSFGQATARRFCADASGQSGPPDLIEPEIYQGRAIGFFIGEECKLTRVFFESAAGTFVDRNDTSAYFDPDKRYIGLGESFIRRTSSEAYGLLRLAGVLAHETAHSFQVAFGVDKMLGDVRGHSVKYVELHADYLAGSYMAWRSQFRAGAPSELRSMFFQLGDDRVESSMHHGNRPQRFMAFARGHSEYQTASRAQGSWPTVRNAAAMGLKYVLSTL